MYREFLCIARTKPGLSEHVKAEFRKNAAIPKTDTVVIEYLMRRGYRQLEMLKKSNVTGMGMFVKDSTKTDSS